MSQPVFRLPSSRRALAAVFATVAVAAASALSLPAHAMPGGHAAMHGAGMGPMAMGHGGLSERMLDSVDATAEQRTQIRALMEAARNDMQAQREAGRSLRQQAMTLFAQPTVDARAAEALRQQMLAQHDGVSKRMTQLMLDVSRVLMPEQRSKLAERMAQRHERMQRQPREHRHLRPQS